MGWGGGAGWRLLPSAPGGGKGGRGVGGRCVVLSVVKRPAGAGAERVWEGAAARPGCGGRRPAVGAGGALRGGWRGRAASEWSAQVTQRVGREEILHALSCGKAVRRGVVGAGAVVSLKKSFDKSAVRHNGFSAQRAAGASPCGTARSC